MTFARLYKDVQQSAKARISTKWLCERALTYSTIKSVKEQWSGLIDPRSLRGFYIEGPKGAPVPLGPNQALIILPREMCQGTTGRPWRRFIYTKELMHIFDTGEEKTDTAEKFDTQIERFREPETVNSPHILAEYKAIGRAAALLCTEAKRVEYQGKLGRGETSVAVVATALRVPETCVEILMHPNYPRTLKSIID